MKKSIGIVILICSILWPQAGFSQGPSCSAQINFLNKFLKLEKAGGRLRSTGKIYSMTLDETHWETSTVIKSYNLETCDLSSGDAKINVSFEVLGTMASSPSGQPDFIPESKTEYADFTVIKKGRHWKVVDIDDFRPHVTSWVAAHSINPEDGQVAKRAIASLKGKRH